MKTQNRKSSRTEKLLKGLALSHLRLVEEAKKNDDYLVFSENGKIVKVKARDIKTKNSAS
jgi:hypothetical protein